MSFWSRIGLVEAPSRLVAYRVDPSNQMRGVAIGTIPALPYQDEGELRLMLNPADGECTGVMLGEQDVILHWMEGLIDAVCFLSLANARAYAGFAPLAASARWEEFHHFSFLVHRGNNVFNEPPPRSATAGARYAQLGYVAA